MGQVGLVELVWILDLDLRVVDLKIQRAREKEIGFFQGDTFRRQLKGSDLNHLRSLLQPDSSRLDLAKIEVPSHASLLAEKIVWSGLKTLAVVQAAFGDELAEQRMAGRLHAAFPGAVTVSRTSRIRGLEESVPREMDIMKWGISRGFDDKGKLLGIVVRSEWAQARPHPEVYWAVSRDGRILSATIVGRVSAKHRRGFAALQDIRLPDLEAASPGTPAACAKQVLNVLQWNGCGPEEGGK
jgi:hypothetical protein